MHGGLNRHELSTVLLLGGAGVRCRQVTSPAGLIDVAPTLLALLRVEIPPTMVGRPLAEAFGAPAMPWREVVAQSGRGGWCQEIRAWRAAGATYLSEGVIAD